MKRPPWRPQSWETEVLQHICFGIYVFSTCDGTGLPLLALLAALHHLQQRRIHYKIIHTFIWETDSDSITMCRKLRESIQYPGHVTEFTDVKGFPRFCETVFIPNNILVLALSGFPCTRISRGARMATRTWDFGLHAPPSNLWWDIHQGYVTLQQRLAFRLITFNENVIPANMIDKAELNNTAGHCQVMNTIRTEGAPRDRFAWTSLGYASPSETIIMEIPPHRLPEGFYMDVRRSNRMYPVLRAIIPSRLYALAADPHSVPEPERSELQKFFIYDPSTYSTRLPTITMLAAFMAVPAVATSAFIEAFPCKPNFGMHSKDGILTSQNCTDHVWCENCSIIAKALGAAWNASTTSRHIAQLLATFAYFCDFPPDITDGILAEETFQYIDPHICTSTCPRNRKSL